MSLGSTWSITHSPSGVACRPFGWSPGVFHSTRRSTFVDVNRLLARRDNARVGGIITYPISTRQKEVLDSRNRHP
jgi:hypothetical protein